MAGTIRAGATESCWIKRSPPRAASTGTSRGPTCEEAHARGAQDDLGAVLLRARAHHAQVVVHKLLRVLPRRACSATAHITPRQRKLATPKQVAAP